MRLVPIHGVTEADKRSPAYLSAMLRPEYGEHPCLGQNGALGPVGPSGRSTMAGRLFGAACLRPST